MYLSRIELDPQKRDTMRALAFPNVMHGAIEQSFESKDERKLWRVDYFNGRCYLLVLSASKPDFSSLAAQFSPANTVAESRDYQPLLDRIEAGQKYRFRLCANPVHCAKNGISLKAGKESRGKVVAHVTQDQQCQWLVDKASKCGFALELGEKLTKTTKKDGKDVEHEVWTHPGFDVVHTTWKQFCKKAGDTKNKVTLRTATFEGELTVTDVEAFKKALVEGMGREKAYGCGLLTIIRVK